MVPSGPDLAALADQVRRFSDQVAELQLELAKTVPLVQERQARAREDFVRHQETFGQRMESAEDGLRNTERRVAVVEDGTAQLAAQLAAVAEKLDAVRMRSAYLLGALAAGGAAGGGIAAAVQYWTGGP